MDHFEQLGGSDAENFAKSESAYGHAAQTPDVRNCLALSEDGERPL